MQRDAPFDLATCMYYTGIDPLTKREVHVARALRDRKTQRALLQYFKPENDFEVRQAFIDDGLQARSEDAEAPARREEDVASRPVTSPP